MLAVTRPTLGKMHSDVDALVVDFLNAYAEELPEELATICTAARDLFLKRHLRVRLGQLFRLTLKQAEQVIVDAGADAGDASGWASSLEDAAGFEFREHSVPESALIAATAGLLTGDSKGPTVRSRERTLLMTVGEELEKDNLADTFVLAECCYDVIEVLDPQSQTISEREVEAFSDAVMEFIGTKFGRYNMGAQFCRTLGKQVEKRLPNLPKGKGGVNRAWWKIFKNKTKNRKHVRPPPPARTRALGADHKHPHARRRCIRRHSRSTRAK